MFPWASTRPLKWKPYCSEVRLTPLAVNVSCSMKLTENCVPFAVC
jgi:hypothetical protein